MLKNKNSNMEMLEINSTVKITEHTEYMERAIGK